MKNHYISVSIWPILMIYMSYDIFPYKNVPFRGLTDTAPHLGGQLLPEPHFGSMNRRFQATCAKYSNFRVIKTNAAILTRFCTTIELSVLWHCWLGVRKSIRPVTNWVMGCWHGYLSGVWCKWFAYSPADGTAISCFSKSRMVCLSGAGLPGLSWKKRLLNVCMCVCGDFKVLFMCHLTNLWWHHLNKTINCYIAANVWLILMKFCMVMDINPPRS